MSYSISTLQNCGNVRMNAYKLQAIIGLDAHVIEINIPAGASCEDIELIYKFRILFIPFIGNANYVIIFLFLLGM